MLRAKCVSWPCSRAPGSYHVGARCGGGSFGNVTLHVT
jgi:hypothetical protein